MSDIPVPVGAPPQPHEGVRVNTGIPIHYVGIESTVPTTAIGSTLGQMLPQIWNYLAERGVTPAAPPFSLYHTYTAEETQMEGGVPVVEPIEVEAPYICRTLNPRQLASAWHVGPYNTLPDTYKRLSEWIEANGYTFQGAPWEVYWSDPSNTDPSETLTEVLWPVVRTSDEKTVVV